MFILCQIETYNKEDMDYIEQMEKLGIDFPKDSKSLSSLPIYKNYVFNTEDIKTIMEIDKNKMSIEYTDGNSYYIKGDFNKLIKYLKQEGIIVSI